MLWILISPIPSAYVWETLEAARATALTWKFSMSIWTQSQMTRLRYNRFTTLPLTSVRLRPPIGLFLLGILMRCRTPPWKLLVPPTACPCLSAIPSIGFLGTVRGIGQALGQAHQAAQGDIAGVTQSLGVAFNSTFVALLISILIMFLMHQLQLAQERTTQETEQYCDQRLLRFLES